MIALPKPEPPETGRTRAGRQRRSDPAWKRRERDLARAMQTMDGPTEDPLLLKLITSTGRLGHLVDLRVDAVSKHYAIECKHRLLPRWILDAWILINQNARDYRLTPLLVLEPVDTQNELPYQGKRLKLPALHAITAERHAELLAKERQLTAYLLERDDGSS